MRMVLSASLSGQLAFTSPRLSARETACARQATPSLIKMFLRWDFTVSGAILRPRAMSLFDCPYTTNISPPSSRGLRRAAVAGARARACGGICMPW